MGIIKPTVGRVVLFHPAGRLAGDQPLAAMVAKVIGDRCVNLGVFGPDGSPLLAGAQSVQLVQPGDAAPGMGIAYCCWMDYQLGQAQRAEAAEKELVARSQGVTAVP